MALSEYVRDDLLNVVKVDALEPDLTFIGFHEMLLEILQRSSPKL